MDNYGRVILLSTNHRGNRPYNSGKRIGEKYEVQKNNCNFNCCVYLSF